METFDEKIEMFKAAGFINHWNFQNTNTKHKHSDELQQQKSLNIHHLRGCFQVFLLGCLISSIVLLIEIRLSIASKTFFRTIF